MTRTKQVISVTMLVALLAFAAASAWAWKSGYRVYTVRTGSMEPAYRPGDAVLVEPDRRLPVPGDVITFRKPSSNRLVTHRVVSVTDGLIVTKGDANESNDTWQLSADLVVGKAVKRLPSFGYVFVFLKQPTGLASILTVVMAIALLWQIFFPSEAEQLRRTDPLLPWSQLAEALESVANTIGGSRPSWSPVDARLADGPARPWLGCAPEPPFSVSWSEVTIRAAESLCDRLVTAA